MRGYAQIPLDGPDRVRSGLRQVRGLCLVIDLSVQSRHVRILSVGLVGSQTKSVVRVVEFGNDTTRPDQRYFART